MDIEVDEGDGLFAHLVGTNAHIEGGIVHDMGLW